MNTRELLYVKTVAEERNISRAAKKLFMAQPSLSQSIQRIEEAVGMPLFYRTNGGLTLTFAGERYCRMAAEVLKRYESFELEISDINNLRTGRIHLGTTNHLGTLALPRILPRFCELCPNIELTITEETSNRLEELLLAGGLDFAIMHAPPEKYRHPQIYCELIKRDPFVIAMSGLNPLCESAVPAGDGGRPLMDLKLLAGEPFLMLQPQQRIRQITNEVLEKAGIPRPNIRLTMRNFETALSLAAKNLGVTLVPLQYARIARPDLAPRFFDIGEEYGAGWDMCIATAEGHYLSKADQLFLTITRQELAEN